jgi:hypothetical protein
MSVEPFIISIACLAIGIGLFVFGFTRENDGTSAFGFVIAFVAAATAIASAVISPPPAIPRHFVQAEARSLEVAATSLAGPGDPGAAPGDISEAVKGYNHWTHDNISAFVSASLIAPQHPSKEAQYLISNSVSHDVACLTFTWATDTWSVVGGRC